MSDTSILILVVGLIAFLLTILDFRWSARMRRLERANYRRVREIAALDKKLEQYIATDERVMELWPAEEAN
jgi:hypothetical protein